MRVKITFYRSVMRKLCWCISILIKIIQPHSSLGLPCFFIIFPSQGSLSLSLTKVQKYHKKGAISQTTVVRGYSCGIITFIGRFTISSNTTVGSLESEISSCSPSLPCDHLTTMPLPHSANNYLFAIK